MMNYLKFPTIDISGIKGVLMDLDDTIYEYTPCHNLALNKCYELFCTFFETIVSKEVFIGLYTEKRNKIKEDMSESGSCRSRLMAFKNLLEELGDPRFLINAVQLKSCYWDNFIDSMKVNPEAFDFICQCNKARIPICVVTDMLLEVQIRKLEKLDLSIRIKYLCSSEEVGIEKPSAKIFTKALSMMGLGVSDVIMIGDSASKDIQGAKNLGIKGYLVKVS